MPKQYQPRPRSKTNLTSITYWRRFAEHRLLYVLLAIIFAFGIVAYFGTGPMGGGPSRADQARNAEQAIVTVNGEPITRMAFERQWDQVKRGVAGSEVQSASFQGYILNNLIAQAAMRSAAKKSGLTVSDTDVEKRIAEEKVQLARGGKPVPDEDYQKMLEAQGLTLSEYKDELKTQMLPQAFRSQFEKSHEPTMDDLIKSYEQAKVRHILISTDKRPEAQAKNRAEKILEELKSGKDFATLANENTEDPTNQPSTFDAKAKKMVPNGQKKGGDLGWAPLSRYVKEFSDAARALKPGQVSGIVKTQFGFHIIKLEDFKRDMPKDFEKNKVKLLADFRKQDTQQQKMQQAFMEIMQAEQKNAKIVWNDPALKWRYEYSKTSGMFGMSSFDMDFAKNQQQFRKDLAAYAAKNPRDAAASLVLGKTIYQHDYILSPAGPEKDKYRNEVIKLYESGLANTEDRETRLQLAQLYREAKKDDQALKQYTLIQRLLRWETGTGNKQVHKQLETALLDLGHPELAKTETVRIAEITAAEQKQAEEAKKREEEAKKKKPTSGASTPGSTKILGSGTFTVPGKGGSATAPTSQPLSAPAKSNDVGTKPDGQKNVGAEETEKKPN